MPRTRRFIISNSVYEVSFRSKDTIAFPCTKYMQTIFLGILARVQRDAKVIVHHFIVEGTHAHIIITAKDARQCEQFYGQIKKQITDSIKRLLGQAHLNLWEDRASVIKLPTPEDVIKKIVYIYSNPSNDRLETSIAKYPGINSWKQFLAAKSLYANISSEHPWIQLPMISKLSRRSLNSKQDKAFASKLLKSSKLSHSLEIYPNLWMWCFYKNPSQKQIDSINKEIIERIQTREAENYRQRIKENKTVLGAEALKLTPLMKKHLHKKKERRIFVQSIFKDIRIALIEQMKNIDKECCRIYQKWKNGDFSEVWPPGTFPPPLPPPVNALV